MGISVNFAMLNKITDDTGDRWDSVPITYSIDVDHGNFIQDIGEFFDGTFDPNIIGTPVGNIPLFIDALRLWDDVVARDIVFQASYEDADITINTADNFEPNVAASTYTTLHTIFDEDADIFVDAKPLSLASAAGKAAWGNLLHEFGHALGLQHPGEYNASEDSAPTYESDRDYNEDTVQFSIMSYFSPEKFDSTITTWTRGNNHPQTPMVYDIMAIQAYYGADTTTRTGNTTYGFNSSAGHQVYDFNINTQPVVTIWDAGGARDRLDVSGFAGTPTQRIDLGEGSYSDVGGLTQNVAIAFGVTIEDATGGGGNDTITGTAAANILVGNAGNDKLTGGSGNDTLDGGPGTDELRGGLDNDTLNGGTENDNLFGEFGVDTLNGNAGDDILDGGGARNGTGGLGTTPDLLTGGTGDDTFVYRSSYRATTVTDFSQFSGNNDRFDLSNTPAKSFVDLLSRGTQQGADAVFDFGSGDVLRLVNVSLDDLEPDGMTFSERSAPGDYVLHAPDTLRGAGYNVRNAPLDGTGGFIEFELRGNGNPQMPLVVLDAFRYDSRGVLIDWFQVNTTPLATWAENYGIRTATLNDGRVVVAWDGYPTLDTNHDRAIQARILSPDGTPIGNDFQVNTTLPVVQQSYQFPYYFRLTDLKATPDGGFYIDWRADENPDPALNVGNQVHIHRRIYDANGQPNGTDFDIGTTNFAFPTSTPAVGQRVTLDSGAVLHTTQASHEPDGREHGYAEIIGITPRILLDRALVSLNSANGVPNDLRASELDDHRIVFTWTQRNFYPLGNNTNFIFDETQAVILNSDLKGFTRPGTPLDDILEGSLDNDRLYGLGGNDTIIGNDSPDVLDGGNDTDTASYVHSLEAVNVDLGRASQQFGGHAEGDTLTSFENLTGSSYGDLLTGDSGPNVIHGGYGKDTIVGGNGDQLFGDQGDDTITLAGPGSGVARGGKGEDTIKVTSTSNGNVAHGDEGDDSFSGGAGRDIFNGGPGDDSYDGVGSIDTAVYAGNRAAYTISHLATLILVDGPDGNDTLGRIERLQFADAIVSLLTDNDFNGDRKSDVLFSNQGAVFASNYEWQLNNRSLLSQGAIDLYDKAFSVQAVGDYDGDGKADVLFQNPTTGGVWQWRLDGSSILSQGAVDVGDPSYDLLGTGDFNGDTMSDVLFRNDAGFLYMWQMNGLANTPLPVGPLDPSWHVQGTGDFNSDGRDDILLRNISAVANENGAYFLWQMNGNLIGSQGGIERPPVAWQTLGIGDFDGDGTDDFAVRNVSATPDNGAVWVYLMSGPAIKSQGAAGIADAAAWKLQQIGDLNGDGKDDILFRNEAGFFYSWNMNGTTIASEGLLEGEAQWAPPSFQVVTPHWDLV